MDFERTIPLSKKYSKAYSDRDACGNGGDRHFGDIALMYVLDFRTRSYNATLQADLRTIYTASIQFHNDHPSDSLQWMTWMITVTNGATKNRNHHH